MKKILIIIAFVLASILCQAQKPQILSPGDSLKVTTKVWVQSIDSEINQRIELKRTKQKLADYVLKTKQIEAIQDTISLKTKEKEQLLVKGLSERDHVIVKLSKQIDESYKEVVVLRKEVVDLQKHLEKSEKQKSFWKKVGIGSTAIIIAIIGLKFI